MNETLKTIAERYACRAYDGRMPEKEKLEAIALAAVQAPSGMNRQPWQIVVLANKEWIDELDAEGMRILKRVENSAAYQRIMGRGGKLFYNAPCMFFIFKKPGTELDCGIVCENIALAATSLGLGSVVCGLASIPLRGENGKKHKEKLGFPEGYELGITVLVGNPVKPGTPHVPDTTKIRFVE